MVDILDELFTVVEAAAKLKVSVPSIRMWLQQGRLERTKVGNRTMITRTELARFVASCNQQPAPEQVVVA